MENSDQLDIDGDVNLIGDYVELALSSASSTVSSIFGTGSSDLDGSSNISTTSSSSGEIRLAAVVPRLLVGGGEEPPSLASSVSAAEARRRKCVGRNNKSVAWGSASVIGRRREMEDAVAVVPGFMSCTCDHVGGCLAPGSRSSLEISPVHFFAVYDGHGSSEVAKFCAGRMHEVVAEEWNQENVDGLEWQERWEAALCSSFERADNEVMTEVASPEIVGSTAVTVVLSGCQIIVSNCGDSRAVLCRGTETIPLTIDQKPDREDELLRIEGLDGIVINWNGDRVFGVLAMTRAIGDRYMRPWIIPVPEVTFMTRSDEDECLILATDGLWDVMSNNEVGEVARRLLRRRRRSSIDSADEISPAQCLADSLIEIALGKNSSDNISVIVVDLKCKKTRQQT